MLGFRLQGALKLSVDGSLNLASQTLATATSAFRRTLLRGVSQGASFFQRIDLIEHGVSKFHGLFRRLARVFRMSLHRDCIDSNCFPTHYLIWAPGKTVSKVAEFPWRFQAHRAGTAGSSLESRNTSAREYESTPGASTA